MVMVMLLRLFLLPFLLLSGEQKNKNENPDPSQVLIHRSLALPYAATFLQVLSLGRLFYTQVTH